MSATSVLHKFLAAVQRWTGTIGTGGVSDATTQTIPLNSATNLVNGTAYVFTINRVNSVGTKQNSWETVIGVLSGSNFINCVRGVEGTAQAWAAGIVVEILMTATLWNKMVEGIEVEHNQDGTHKAALVTTLGATASDVTAGTSTTKIATPKALKDAGLAPMVAATASDITAGSDTSKYATPKALADAGLTVTPSSTTTWLNKRNTRRVQTVTDAATITPNADTDDNVDITAIAQAFTIANPSGTPTNKQTIWVTIKDNGTARAITFGNGYVAGGYALPSTTIAGKIMNLGFAYNTANSLNKWQLVAFAQEA